MKTYNTKVGTTACFKNRTWNPYKVLFFQKEELDCTCARLAEKTSDSVDYHTHRDTGRITTGTMLTCISKPSTERAQSVWMVTDPKSKYFGKLTIFNGRSYNIHINMNGDRVGYPTPTHYNLVEND